MENPSPSAVPGTHQHIFKRFDEELENLRRMVLELGHLVESQVTHAIQGMYTQEKTEREAVAQENLRIVQLEQDIDLACSKIIARRQPAAIDLRFILSVQKGLTDLKRVSRKAMNIADMGERLGVAQGGFLPLVDLRPMAEHTLVMLRLSLEAFSQLDAHGAAKVVRLDEDLNTEHEGMTRRVMTFMMEDPRTITRAMDILGISKALERVGDHAKGLAEHVIYAVTGKNVQHAKPEEIDAFLKDFQ